MYKTSGMTSSGRLNKHRTYPNDDCYHDHVHYDHVMTGLGMSAGVHYTCVCPAQAGAAVILMLRQNHQTEPIYPVRQGRHTVTPQLEDLAVPICESGTTVA